MAAHRRWWLPVTVWLGCETRSGSALVAFRTEAEARKWASEAPDSIGAVTARRIWRTHVRQDSLIYRAAVEPAHIVAEVER